MIGSLCIAESRWRGWQYVECKWRRLDSRMGDLLTWSPNWVLALPMTNAGRKYSTFLQHLLDPASSIVMHFIFWLFVAEIWFQPAKETNRTKRPSAQLVLTTMSSTKIFSVLLNSQNGRFLVDGRVVENPPGLCLNASDQSQMGQICCLLPWWIMVNS